jgi:hypothetical protein
LILYYKIDEDDQKDQQVLAFHSDHALPSVESSSDQVTFDSEEQDFIVYQTVQVSFLAEKSINVYSSSFPPLTVLRSFLSQQTLNTTWTLTWHPNPENIKEFQINPKPIMINIWMERGTVITHSGVVVEPMFMWRDAYQSHYMLQQRKRLNPSCQKPWSMRLLNTCRIAPIGRNLDKSKYPLARRANCLIVKTCQGQEFLLEANSASQMELICERWKITVARFASLAVTEDIDAIAQEFFHPTLSAQTLTVQQQQQRQQRQQQHDVHDISSSSSSCEDSSSSEDVYRTSISPSTGSGPRVSTPTVIARPVPEERGTSSCGNRWSEIYKRPAPSVSCPLLVGSSSSSPHSPTSETILSFFRAHEYYFVSNRTSSTIIDQICN